MTTRKRARKDEDKWSCSKCSFGNEPVIQNCEMCGETKPANLKERIYSFIRSSGPHGRHNEPWQTGPGTSTTSESLGSQVAAGIKKLGSKIFGTTEQWICPLCGFANRIDLPICEQCDGKPHGYSDKIGWSCPCCTFDNHPDLLTCEQCGQPHLQIPPHLMKVPLEEQEVTPLKRHLGPYSLEPEPHLQGHSLEPHPKPINDSSNETLQVITTATGEQLIGNSTVIKTLLDQGKTVIDLTIPELQEHIICPHCTSRTNEITTKCKVCQLPMDSSSTHNSVHVPVSFQRQQSRSLTVSEARQNQEDHALATWYTIVEKYKQLKESFIDPDFPHSDHSLYCFPSKPLTKWYISSWMKPQNIVTEKGRYWCVYRQPQPDDIAQGSLGDCWFLSALAVIAEVPELLQQIIITKELCPQGVYLVRLCQDGLWKSILIDDYFPVHRDRRLAFSKARRCQLWVPLIEKALAKMYGCYESLDGGQIIGGLSVLTGYPCEQVILRNGKESGESVDLELVWAKLLSFKESKFPMAVSSSPVDPIESMSGQDNAGIQPFHAYSILDMKQIGTESLVLLRDPWGHTNYWKPGHEWMESVPGTFWIGANDLFKYFSHVDVCHYHPDWHSIRVSGQLLPYAPSNFNVLTFQTFAPTEIKLCLYQPSYRGRDKDSPRKVDLTLLIVRYEGSGDHLDTTGSLPYPLECVVASKCTISSVVTCFTLLNPGRYAIVPLTFANWQNYNRVPYVLALFSSKVIEWLEHVPTKPGFISESLFLLAKKKGTLKQFSSQVRTYQVHLRHFCYYFVIENCDSYHVRIQLDATRSCNVKSSRNELVIDDFVPPNHRQILVVFSPLIADNTSWMIQTSFCFSTVPTNPFGQWGSHMSPPLTEINRELHSPRLVL